MVGNVLGVRNDMSELGETFKAFKEERQKKRWSNYDQSLNNLTNWKIPFVVLNKGIGHILVCNDIDFWPTTGRWRRRVFGHTGRGIQKLKHYIEARIKIESKEDGNHD